MLAKMLVGEPPQTLVVAKSALFRFRLSAKTAHAPLLLLSPRNPLRWACAGPPIGCVPMLTLRAFTSGQNVPKQKCRGTAKSCSLADRKMWKVFSNIRTGHIIILPPQKTRLETLANRAFFRANVHTSALFFKVFPIAENTADSPPIRTPRTRRSFRCLLRGGCCFVRDLFHHALIGTVGKVHK